MRGEEDGERKMGEGTTRTVFLGSRRVIRWFCREDHTSCLFGNGYQEIMDLLEVQVGHFGVYVLSTERQVNWS